MENKSNRSYAVCNDILFFIEENKSSVYIHNKYNLGVIRENTLVLKSYEAIYLLLLDRIKSVNSFYSNIENFIAEVLSDDDIAKMKTYIEIKKEGAKVSIEKNYLSVARKQEKNENGRRVYPIMEDSVVNTQWFSETLDSFVASVDEDGDITYYYISEVTMAGHNALEPIEAVLKKIGRRALTSSSKIPSWMGYGIGKTRALSEHETMLIEGSKTEEAVFKVYLYLVEHGMIVKSGFKYGCNFRVYKESIDSHSDFLVQTFSKKMEWYEVSRAVRVGNSVRKEMIFSYDLEGELKFIKVKRVKSIF